MNILTGGVRKTHTAPVCRIHLLFFCLLLMSFFSTLTFLKETRMLRPFLLHIWTFPVMLKSLLFSRFFKRAQSSIRAGTFVKDNSCAQSAVDIFRSMFYYYCIIMYLMNESTCVLMTTTIAYSHSVLGMFMKCFMRCLLVQRHDV